ncbi:hypothetical protein TIFTF001_030064 [Ficus carica]|uniref:CC-NBS-LRR protein n=1 Tax=Ficus carica TaxID=3494 RepID=A0AA88DTF9_FICCA|nr:hypothetical protein TIFTF001_030064 [Ficus carica]
MLGSCESLRSFPLNSFPKLKQLSIYCSESLESLSVSDGLCEDLRFLSSLHIRDCLTFVSFPEAGLSAPDLTSLEIENCEKLKSLLKKMHDLLPSLKFLFINDCPEIESFPEDGLPFSFYEDVESFPEEGLLPNTITSLSISRFPCLKALDKNGLQELTSLKKLDISNCPELQKFTEEGFPISLEQLRISSCPLLEKKCNREKGQY